MRIARACAVSVITRIEITHHQLPLDPPFPASWDPKPRTKFPATIVRVHDDEGRTGIGSGDAMYGFADYARLLHRRRIRSISERHHAVLSNVAFHAGRPWPMDVALWDLAGKIRGEPVWQLVGGAERRIRAYASSGVQRPIDETVEVARRAVEARLPGAEAAIRAGEHRRRHRGGAGGARCGGRSAGADGRLQPGLADAVGHAGAVGCCEGDRRGAAAGRRAAVLDRGAAASGRLRRATPS